jgi:hypothetical protein
VRSAVTGGPLRESAREIAVTLSLCSQTFMHDTRKEPRHRQRVPVVLGRMTLFTVNVGRGGFCTELLRVLAPGTHVEGAIRVRGREYAYSGRVVWSREGSPRMNVRGRMGIRFLSVAPDLVPVVAALSHPPAPASPARPPRGGREG